MRLGHLLSYNQGKRMAEMPKAVITVVMSCESQCDDMQKLPFFPMCI